MLMTFRDVQRLTGVCWTLLHLLTATPTWRQDCPGYWRGNWSCTRHVQMDPCLSKHPCPSVQLQNQRSVWWGRFKENAKKETLSLRKGRRTSRNDVFIYPLEIKIRLGSQDMCTACSQGFARPRPSGGTVLRGSSFLRDLSTYWRK